MRKNPDSISRSFNLRLVFAAMLCLFGLSLAVSSFAPAKPEPLASKGGPRLAAVRPDFTRRPAPAALNLSSTTTAPGVLAPAAPFTPTFGHPVISGIGGVGFEQDLRLDPSNSNLAYTSAPGSLSSGTSWIWHSRDGGKTFKWITAATPLVGKAVPCAGGGDTELGVDSAGHLYFNDLTLANFSVGRSDDGGVTFPCNNTGVPDTAVDRQWYATDGDPVNAGGNLYLANDEIGPGGVMCGDSTGNNVLVMYRSPVSGAGATAGLQFGPANKVTADLSCDEAIMGNNEVSPVATTTGKLNPGPTILPTAVKHVYVIHDNAALDEIQIGRCFPVTFGPPVVNVSDPSGLNCDNLPVASFPGFKTGADFPTMAIDKAGNLYAVWSQAPAAGGDTVLEYSYSTNEGNTWSTPTQIDTSGSSAGTLHNNIFAWMAAGDDGRVDIAWYGSPGSSTTPDACTSCNWSLWMVQSLNAHAGVPTFNAPILASEHFIHHGSIQTLIGGQTGDRTLGDFLQLRIGASGEAQIGYADSNNIDEAFAPHGMYVRQNGGAGLFVANSPINISGLTPFNTVTDPAGDGKYEVSGIASANMPQLDILTSTIGKLTSAPCSVVAPCYQVVMQLSNLSLAPTIAQDPDLDLVWLTQWFVPSTTDVTGGKNFFVYAESTNGGALTCYYGENAASVVGGGLTLTYPGTAALPAANCQQALGANGTITIDVPFTNVSEPGAIDNRLHEVTASTMTLQQPANTVPSVGGIGGVLFNLIDVAQGYTFDPIPAPIALVSRKIHGGAGTFDINLLPPANGIECRTGGANGDHQMVITFPLPVSMSSATVTSGTGSVASSSVSGNVVTVNLTGVANAQRLTVTLNGLTDANGSGNVPVNMAVLAGDTNADTSVNSADISQTKAQSGKPVTGSNFREDVTVDGNLNSADIGLVKSKSGTALP